MNLPAPDLVVFLDISQQSAAARGGFGGERYEESTMQGRVRELFSVVGSSEGDFWKVVDAARSVEDVETDVVKLVRAVVDAVQREKRPMRRVQR